MQGRVKWGPVEKVGHFEQLQLCFSPLFRCPYCCSTSGRFFGDYVIRLHLGSKLTRICIREKGECAPLRNSQTSDLKGLRHNIKANGERVRVKCRLKSPALGHLDVLLGRGYLVLLARYNRHYDFIAVSPVTPSQVALVSVDPAV